MTQDELNELFIIADQIDKFFRLGATKQYSEADINNTFNNVEFIPQSIWFLFEDYLYFTTDQLDLILKLVIEESDEIDKALVLLRILPYLCESKIIAKDFGHHHNELAQRIIYLSQ